MSNSKTLLLSWAIPPQPLAAAVVVENLAKQFGPDEMILAGIKPTTDLSVQWDDTWAEIVYIGRQNPFKRGARWWNLLQFPSILWRTLRLIRQQNCQDLICVYPTELFLFVTYIVSILTNIRCYPYLHNTYVENRSGFALRWAKFLQSRLFSRATHVFVMSQGMVDLYTERYPKLDCSALTHSFNEPLPTNRQLSAQIKPKFAIMGNINQSCLEATHRLAKTIATRFPQAELTYISGLPRHYYESQGLLHGRFHHKTVLREELIPSLQEADIVILPHGFTGGYSPEEYRTIFPTKTIEYLICGRPILAHSPPNSFLTTFLDQHDCTMLVTEPDEEALVAAIQTLIDDVQLRESLVQNAIKAAMQFQAPAVADLLRAKLARST